jgi:hypothetical protein
MLSSFLRHDLLRGSLDFKIGSASDAHQGDALCLRLETVRHLAAGVGKLDHDLLVQPNVHFRPSRAQELERADTNRCVASDARLASTPTPQDDVQQKPSQDDFKGASR